MLKQHIKNFFRQRIPAFPPAEFLVAVSGGLDSMVLLHLIVALAKNMVPSFKVVHFNHHLRGEASDVDERFVASFCRQHAFELIVGQGRDIPEQRRQRGLSLEDAARQSRYAFFDRCLRQQAKSWLLTAHTASDQAETVVMNLLRGSGLRGLKGIPAQRQRILRPLLAIDRKDIQTYARRHDIPFVEDDSNASFEFTRNRIRHQVMPVLKREAGGKLEKRLSAMADGLAADLALIDALAEEFIEKWVDIDTDEQSLIINRHELLRQHPGLLPHICERCIRLAGNQKQLSRRTLLTLVKMAGNETGKTVATFQLANGLQYKVHRKRIVIGYLDAVTRPAREFSLEIPGIGCYSLPGQLGMLEIKQVEAPVGKTYRQGFAGNSEIFAADTVFFPLLIRSWKAGDIFFPLGMHGKRKKVKNFFIDSKIPLDKKQDIPILCHDRRIIWLVGQRLDERFAITSTTKTFLKVTYHGSQHH